MSNDPLPVPGWYQAPHANDELRYWDGKQWTEWTPESAAAASIAAQSSAGADSVDARSSTEGFASPSAPAPHTAHATATLPPHDGARPEPSVAEPRSGVPWWGWLLIGLGAFGLLVTVLAVIAGAIFSSTTAGAGSSVSTPSPVAEPGETSDTRVDTPDVVGMTVGEARAAIEGAGLVFDVIDGAADDWIVATQTISVPAPPGTEVFVTATAPEPVGPAVPTQSFPGSGDNVVDVEITDPAIVTFDCPACTSNTILRTNGSSSLLVNEIGSYRGQHLINVYDGDATTRFTVEAEGDWTITVEDLSTAEQFTGAASGSGDRVIYMSATFDVASITNDGDSNFIIYAYGAENTSPLIVNEIGAYSGTLEMMGPAFVQVESTGNWSITPQ